MKRTKEQHYEALRDISVAVSPLIDDWLYAEMPPSFREAVLSSMELCLERRRYKPLLRPLLARMCYEITGGEAWRNYLPILTSAELLNISTYQSNFCFDEKAGVKTTPDRNNQFICSMLTLSRAITLVESCPSLGSEAKSAIIALIAQSNYEVYQGQFYDLNLLNLDRVSYFQNIDSFLNEYATRCDLIAGSTFRACAAGALINDAPMKILKALFSYLGALGAAAQVINDLGDYIPHVTKDYALPYSDLQLGRLTLPAYLLHKAGLPLDEWRRVLREKGDVPFIEKTLTDAIQDLKIEWQVRQFVKTRFFPIVRESISLLEKSVGKERSVSFWFAYPYIFESRMLRFFRPDRVRVW